MIFPVHVFALQGLRLYLPIVRLWLPVLPAEPLIVPRSFSAFPLVADLAYLIVCSFYLLVSKVATGNIISDIR